MEAMLAVLRPNHDTLPSLGELNFSSFQILLDNGKLLSTNILLDVEPANVLCNYLYITTGGDAGGLKGKRAVFVPPTVVDNSALYCIPLDKTDKIIQTLTSSSLSFFSLERWLGQFTENKFKTYSVIGSRLQNWLIEKHKIPGALSLLFSSSSDDRFKWSISNPAFIFNATNSIQSNYNHCDTLTHMVSCDRCDITKNNPLFGSNMSFKYKVNRIVVNKNWGLRRDDAHLTSSSSSNKQPELMFISDSARRNFLKQSYPLHFYVSSGNIDGVKKCLKMGFSVLQRNTNYETPVHMAADKGHVEILELMFNESRCDINVLNHLKQSLLHVATRSGRHGVVEFLLKRGADLSIKDSYGRTAAGYCEDQLTFDSEACYRLLRRHVEQPVGTIDIHLMDSTCVRLNLPSQADSTVEQLHAQMMMELKLPENCSHLFTIWICSKNLQLQLKPDHKPIHQLNNWKRNIVGKLTDQPPELEDPELYWKRDVLLSLSKENFVTNPTAINLLYLEAYHNYIKSLYLCTYHDVVLLAGILMQLFFGDFKEPCDHFLKKPQLYSSLVPSHMLSIHGKSGLAEHITEQYKGYSGKCVNKSAAVHQMHFLKVCRLLTTYACAFFTGYKCSKNRVKNPIFIGVNDVGLHIITVNPREMVKSFLYKDIDWNFQQLNHWQELQIKTKLSKKLTHVYLTKQAGLINNLMKRLYELNSDVSS